MHAKIAAAMIVAGALFTIEAGTALAASGYGPTAPTGPVDAPGGYDTVVETQTVSSSGSTISPGATGGASDVSLVVPSGAFAQPTQIEITAPDVNQVSGSLSSVGFNGYTAVGGIGVKALDANGQPLTGSFAKPLVLTLSGPNFGRAGEKVIEFDGASSVTVIPATLGQNSVTIELTKDPDIAVINPPAASATGTASGATTATTGKPFLGEEAIAATALCAGAVGLAVAARRRRRATQV